MQLFSDSERTDAGPASHSEDSFAYHNRSARVGAVNIRSLLQEWFDQYPSAEQVELTRLFCTNFESAFFELFLHQTMIKLGIDVHVHPALPPPIVTSPDFQMIAEGELGYLEARVAWDESASKSKEQKVMAALYDQINSLPVPDYHLKLISCEVGGGRQPSTRRLKREILQWLGTLDYETITKAVAEPLDSPPLWKFEDDGLTLVLSLMPVSEARRGDPGHWPIGVYPMVARWGGTKPSLRKALKRKGTKYGKMTSPYIIAVNSLSFFGADHIDQMEALFGSEQFIISPHQNEPEMTRAADGFWQGPQGPRNTRVSAVLFCQVQPSNVDKAEVCLYHNPYAAHAYDGPLTALPQGIPLDRKMEWKQGAALGEILHLAPDWLGE